jgi:hypothetical protein
MWPYFKKKTIIQLFLFTCFFFIILLNKKLVPKNKVIKIPTSTFTFI